MQISLAGKTALITGATGHIGRAIAETFAECGAAVALLDQNEEQCATVCQDLTDRFGVRTLPVPCDLTNDASTHAAPHTVADALGGLDILVNNAAFVGTTKLEGWVTDFAHQTTDTCAVLMTFTKSSKCTLQTGILARAEQNMFWSQRS